MNYIKRFIEKEIIPADIKELVVEACWCTVAALVFSAFIGFIVWLITWQPTS